MKTIEPGIRDTDPSTQFPKGGYQARLTYRGSQHERTFARLADARRWRNDTLTDLRRGQFVDDAKGLVPLREVTEQWIAAALDLKPKTKAGYESILNKPDGVLETFGRVPIGRIRRADIQAWIGDLSVDASPNTVRNAYRVLTPIFNFAIEHELIRISPASGIKLPKAAGHEEMHFLTPEQVRLLADEITSPYGTLVTFAAYTGLRAGELGGLRVKHLNLLRKRVDVRESVADVNGKLYFGPPKSRSSIRSVPLPAFLVEQITAYLDDRPKSKEDLVFTAKNGGPMRHGNFYRRHFKPAVQRVSAFPPELASLRFHDLRHTYAAFLIDQGAHPKMIQQCLGHSSITTTLDVYGHLFPSMDEQLGAKLDDIFRNGNGDNVVLPFAP